MALPGSGKVALLAPDRGPHRPDRRIRRAARRAAQCGPPEINDPEVRADAWGMPGDELVADASGRALWASGAFAGTGGNRQMAVYERCGATATWPRVALLGEATTELWPQGIAVTPGWRRARGMADSRRRELLHVLLVFPPGRRRVGRATADRVWQLRGHRVRAQRRGRGGRGLDLDRRGASEHPPGGRRVGHADDAHRRRRPVRQRRGERRRRRRRDVLGSPGLDEGVYRPAGGSWSGEETVEQTNYQLEPNSQKVEFDGQGRAVSVFSQDGFLHRRSGAAAPGAARRPSTRPRPSPSTRWPATRTASSPSGIARSRSRAATTSWASPGSAPAGSEAALRPARQLHGRDPRREQHWRDPAGCGAGGRPVGRRGHRRRGRLVARGAWPDELTRISPASTPTPCTATRWPPVAARPCSCPGASTARRRTTRRRLRRTPRPACAGSQPPPPVPPPPPPPDPQPAPGPLPAKAEGDRRVRRPPARQGLRQAAPAEGHPAQAKQGSPSGGSRSR